MTLLRRWAWPLLIGYFAVLLAPVLASQLHRPAAFWDDLTIPKKLALGWAQRAADLPGALLFFWFGESYVFRPVILFYYNVFYLIFGGELWILQLLKTAARAGYLVLTNQLLVKLDISPPSRLVVFTFLLFHPALSDMMLFGDDTWLALAIAGALVAAVRESKWFDLSQMTLGRYAAFAALTIAALGAKEVGIVFAALICGVTAWRTAASSRWRLLPLWITTGYAAFHLAEMASLGHRVNIPDSTLLAKLDVLADHLRWAALPFPMHLSEILLPPALLWGAARFWKAGDASRRILLAVVCASAAGILLLTSNVQMPAIRYVVPAVMLLAVPMAAAIESLEARAWPVAIAFAVLFPLVMIGNWYSMALEQERTLYQFSQVLTSLERKSQEGLTLAISENLPEESRDALKAYFEKSRQRHYGASGPIPIQPVKHLPEGSAVLVTLDPPSRMRSEPGYVERLTTVESFPPGREGMLESLTSLFVAIRASLGFRVLLGDLAFPKAGDGAFHLHTLAPYEEPAGRIRRYEVRPGEPFRIAIAAGSMSSLADAVYPGKIKIESGGVLFGFADAGGAAFWETALAPTAEWVDLPAAPPLSPPPGKPVNLTLRVPVSAVFSLKDLRVARVLSLAPSRRYGAMLR